MRPLVRRSAALSLGTMIAGATALLALGGDTWFGRPSASDPSLRLAAEAPARDRAVRAELARLGEHPWAGEYRTAGRNASVLRLAPIAGFTLYHDSWCGTCQRFGAIGRVVRGSETRLELDVELAEEPGARPSVAPHLHLVRWGELSFAVEPSRMEAFCAAVANGRSFPRAPFRYLGGDPSFDFEHPARPACRPEVPPEHRRLIPDSPIVARIVAIAGSRPRSPERSGGTELQELTYSIDRGADAGLAVGMVLFADPRGDGPGLSGRVEHVERDRATFTALLRVDQLARAEAWIGAEVGTLHPLAREETR